MGNLCARNEVKDLVQWHFTLKKMQLSACVSVSRVVKCSFAGCLWCVVWRQHYGTYTYTSIVVNRRHFISHFEIHPNPLRSRYFDTRKPESDDYVDNGYAKTMTLLSLSCIARHYLLQQKFYTKNLIT